jgi:pantetheine-phosphate adenylyltransferase
MIRAVYPGTFDPLTRGHEDIVRRAASLFDGLIIGVADSQAKRPFFTRSERVDMASEVLSDLKNVKVVGFSGLIINFIREHQARVIMRGLRAVADFEYEFQMTMMNRHLAGDVETVFLMADEAHFFTSSRLVKEVISLGGDVSGFVPEPVYKALSRKIS